MSESRRDLLTGTGPFTLEWLVSNCWILGGAMAGMKIFLSGPQAYGPDPLVDTWLEEAGLPKTYRFTSDVMEAARDADVIYTDVWTSMGQEAEAERRRALFPPYQLNAALLAEAEPDALVMHCLPDHKGYEVSDTVIYHPNSVVFDQAENKMHLHQALLEKLLIKM